MIRTRACKWTFTLRVMTFTHQNKKRELKNKNKELTNDSSKQTKNSEEKLHKCIFITREKKNTNQNKEGVLIHSKWSKELAHNRQIWMKINLLCWRQTARESVIFSSFSFFNFSDTLFVFILKWIRIAFRRSYSHLTCRMRFFTKYFRFRCFHLTLMLLSNILWSLWNHL